METTLTKFNAALLEIETRVEATRTLKKAAREEEVRTLEGRLTGLENEIAQFQMKNPYHFQDEINELESKAIEIRAAMDSLLNMASKVPDASQVPQPKPNDNWQAMDQALVHHGNEGLAEAKAIALNLVKTAEKMREEVNLIDDEVMLQKEKLVRINRQIKETQDITIQTQKLVRFVTLTVNQDKFIKVMIGLVTLMLLAVLTMAVCIRFRQAKFDSKTNVIQVRKLDFTEKEVNPGGFLKVRMDGYATEWLDAQLDERDFYLWGHHGLIGEKDDQVVDAKPQGGDMGGSIIDFEALEALAKAPVPVIHPDLKTGVSKILLSMMGMPVGVRLDPAVRDQLPPEYKHTEKGFEGFTDAANAYEHVTAKKPTLHINLGAIGNYHVQDDGKDSFPRHSKQPPLAIDGKADKSEKLPDQSQQKIQPLPKDLMMKLGPARIQDLESRPRIRSRSASVVNTGDSSSQDNYFKIGDPDKVRVDAGQAEARQKRE